eukprot:TRINITY_DN1702_c0_g1_i2.p1 TRINITY_DN1702_c0_g1~~TRINITY_DN1702_c0_g1_i2.p1  ORF type:complete len:846 (-),score=82.03 TRINITY_DN1702_c0_g1_i2:2094-4358(-)
MFGWLKRLFGIAQAEAHSAISKLEDPVKMTEQGIRDLKNDLNKSLQSLAEVKAMHIRGKTSQVDILYLIKPSPQVPASTQLTLFILAMHSAAQHRSTPLSSSRSFVSITSIQTNKVAVTRKQSKLQLSSKQHSERSVRGSLVVKSILLDKQPSAEMKGSPTQVPAWEQLSQHKEEIERTHLKELMVDEPRTDALIKEHNGVLIDFSRQRATQETLDLLIKLAEECNLKEKIDAMFNGDRINSTEDRSVLHVATRARRDQKINVDGQDVVPQVWEVLDKIKSFTEEIRSGQWKGITGKPLTNVVAIGIGGSYLGPLFVHTALRTESHAMAAARGRKLRFLANVDPIDVASTLQGLDQETTLVVVISKTFTTAETMLNARTVRTWLTAKLGQEAVAKHMVAVSTNLALVEKFGIDPANAFGFWDWVGGRYSVCSAVGILPLALQYGFELIEQFLQGANDMDEHFKTADFKDNLPVVMGLLSVWNDNFLGYHSRAILPYCQALAKFPSHIQQVSMESNGKGVDINGESLQYVVGEVDFGEPGTNGQHSFYQLIHQGQIVPCEFIGIVRSQQSVYLKGEIVSNHDELMCNFFAQADALAYGKDAVELRSESCPDHLIPHKTFTGNRPSMSILLPACNAYCLGQLLSLYEHRVAVQGFIWNINSFDQFGVELGKVLASRVRKSINDVRTKKLPVQGFNYSTTKLINRYIQGKAQLVYPEPRDVFPINLLDVPGVDNPISSVDEELLKPITTNSAQPDEA